MNTQLDRAIARPGPFARAIYGLDAYLCKRQGIFEFSDAPDCIFRAHIETLEETVRLSDGTALARGDRIISLHIWNAQFPGFPAAGPTLKWARRLSRMISFSLGELVRYLDAHPELADIRAVRGNMAVGLPGQTPRLVRLARRFGFEPVPDAGPSSSLSRLHRLGENILIMLFQLAGNPASLGSNGLRRGRTQVFLSRTQLERLYGP